MSAVTRKISHGPISYEQNYTYEEWLEMENPEGIAKLELIDGKLYAMAAPGTAHQSILAELIRQFTNYLIGKRCRLYPGIGVRLAKDTVYIPDMVVVCDPNKINERGCEGAPDLIIEILSPSNIRHDRATKMKAYRRAGVKEYWIVDPENYSVEVYSLVNEMYVLDVYEKIDKTMPVKAIPDFEIDLSTVFRED